ncbi:MAG: alpha/beta hydrolase [Deltaproteobacteria bacterium]|nr:alpha/beta hydrolase [Deltaproteobacteria bacterium]
MTIDAWLYLHGFASSPGSTKAKAFVQWGKERGVDVRALDLRAPSLEHLRFSAILERVKAAIGPDPRTRVALVGSSLGGLTAARVAEADRRVAAVFAMAPAFRLAERWRMRLGEEAWARWRESGALAIDDWSTGGKTTVDFGFVEELGRLDVGFPDVQVPVRIVHGTKDEIVDIGLSRAWSEGRPNVQLVEVDDGHELTASLPRVLAKASDFFRPLLPAP